MPYIPVTLPAQFADTMKDWGSDIKIADYSPVIAALKETWDLQTFKALEAGEVAVPDDVINQSLASALEDNAQVKELTIASQADHNMKITAVTPKMGHIVLVCKIMQFEQDKEHSSIKLKVLDKKLPDKPFLSWIFARVSLAMVSKMVGNIQPGHGLEVAIHGNEVTIDFQQALYNSKLGGMELFGYKPLDAVSISEAMPEAGCVVFKTAVNLPENVKSMVKNVLE